MEGATCQDLVDFLSHQRINPFVEHMLKFGLLVNQSAYQAISTCDMLYNFEGFQSGFLFSANAFNPSSAFSEEFNP